ncbi:MAG: diguanylate cyclase [Magnetococcales bacterium]|nr:diguanylate cyclase [Magnetococcales bacterium]
MTTEKKPTILVVDDEPENVKVLLALLQEAYRVLLCRDGHKALELALSQLPDLILLDVVLPGMDGYQVCSALRQHEATREIPVIFVTSLGEEESEERGFDVGGVDFIPKPFRPRLVRARISTHLELKRKRDLLRDLSTLDGLTGLANRRRLDEFLHAEWKRAVRQGCSQLSVILMDVDHFKKYNDGYGHAAGDECLRKIARTLRDSLERGTDLAARYGGEEFACILPETTFEGAMALANKVQRHVVGLAIPHAFSESGAVVTLSLGVATTRPDARHQPESLLETADRLLYRAKQEGRNRVRGEEAEERP